MSIQDVTVFLLALAIVLALRQPQDPKEERPPSFWDRKAALFDQGKLAPGSKKGHLLRLLGHILSRFAR